MEISLAYPSHFLFTMILGVVSDCMDPLFCVFSKLVAQAVIATAQATVPAGISHSQGRFSDTARS